MEFCEGCMAGKQQSMQMVNMELSRPFEEVYTDEETCNGFYDFVTLK